MKTTTKPKKKVPAKANQTKKAKKNPHKFLELFGIWADREDMKDSVKWVQNLRAGRRDLGLRS